MLTFLTGKPGAGKSQILVKRWIVDVRQDKDPAVANRPIYTNITGLKVEAIKEKFGGPLVLPAPDDWRDTPEGSLVIYDEAQFIFPATGKPGAPDDPRLTDLAIHRKGGRDIVMATQDPTLVHHWARKFIGQHVHAHRPNNMDTAIVYQWNKYQPDPDDHFAIKEADESRYSYLPWVWDLYDSATVHTHKFKMPAGSRWIIRASLVLAVLIGAGIAYTAWASRDAVESAAEAGKHQIDVPTTPRPAGAQMIAPPSDPVPVSIAYAWRETTPTVRPINGCVASQKRCRCFDFDGQMLDLDQGICHDLADGTIAIPLDLNRFQGGGSSASPDETAQDNTGPVDFIGSAKDAIIGDAGGGGKTPTGVPPPATAAQ